MNWITYGEHGELRRAEVDYDEVGGRLYVVQPFSPAAHDGDPLLHVDGYHAEAWSLTTWGRFPGGTDTVGPARIFASLDSAMAAAENGVTG